MTGEVFVRAADASRISLARLLIVRHAMLQERDGPESPLTRSVLAQRDAALQAVRDVAAMANPVVVAYLERWLAADVPPLLKTAIADGLEDRRLAALIPNPLR